VKNKDIKRLILDYLDGEASSEEKRLLEQICKENSEISDEKASFEKLIRLMKSSPKMDAPPGFTESVMSKIGKKPIALKQRLIKWIRSDLDIHLNWVWKWSLVFTIVFLIMAGTTWHYFRLRQFHDRVDQIKGQFPAVKNQPVPMRFFFFKPSAQSVYIAGSFNDWQIKEQFRLDRLGGEGVWTIMLMLKPGEYEYMFLVDGKDWVTDPTATDFRADGFGHKNSILEVSWEI